MISLQVIGNLGRDATVNNVNGKNVINFSVCHTDKYKDASGQQKEKQIWVEAAYWSDKTNIAEYLKKGTLVFVEGLPESKMYKKQDGSQVASLTLRVGKVNLLSKGNDSGNSGNNRQHQQQVEDLADDLPF